MTTIFLLKLTRMAASEWVPSTSGMQWKPGAAIAGSFLFGGLRVLKYYVPKGVIEIPIAFYDMLPFLITALVLVLGSMKKSRGAQIPASLGLNYFREER